MLSGSLVQAQRYTEQSVADFSAQYVDWTQQASQAYQAGDISKAIEFYEKALPIAPSESFPVIYNNLAAVYLKRGLTSLNTQKQPQVAISDFRQAFYLLDFGWPEGIERKPLHDSNRKIAREDLDIAYEQLKIPVKDRNAHFKLAKELRQGGRFKEALVEFNQVLTVPSDANALSTQAESLRAMGDLFTVLNSPEKAKKYLTQLLSLLGSQATDDDFVRLANAQNKTGDADNAVINYNRALEKNPGNQTALGQLESIWIRELKINTGNTVAHANLASILQKKKNYAGALQEYQYAEYYAQRDPKATLDVKKMIRLNLGTLYQETRRFDLALSAYNTVLQIAPQETRALLSKASLLKDQGATEDALKAYYQLLTVQPDLESAHQAIFAIIVNPALSPEAQVQGLKDYAQRFPSNALIQSKIGEQFHQRKLYDDAISAYQNALNIKPDMTSALANLGAAYQAKGDYNQAAEAFEKARALEPKNPLFAKLAQDLNQVRLGQDLNQGLALQQAGKYAESIPFLEKAVDKAQFDKTTSPSSLAEILAALGVAYQNTNRLDDALTQYNKATESDKSNASYVFYQATVYHQQQNWEKAKASYQKTIQLATSVETQELKKQAQDALQGITQSQSDILLNQIAEAYNQKAYLKGLGAIDTLLKQSPGNATAYYYRGLILLDQNKAPLAINSFKEAVRYDKSLKDAYYSLGIALDKANRKIEAKEAFKNFVTLASGDSTIDAALLDYAKQRVGQ
ncbi:MAG: tetratricopeptide repeat protein [Cyanobacteria bacterium]|nr:tetratricopeptide repeat protein [Cyanobacteriota bacterium]